VVRRDNPQETTDEGDCHEERRPRSFIESGQRFDRRDHHQAIHGAGERRIECDERVGLQLGQCDVLGVERVGPPELVGDLPCDVLKDTVSEQSDPQRARGSRPRRELGEGPRLGRSRTWSSD
jgi:hypothetical protein